MDSVIVAVIVALGLFVAFLLIVGYVSSKKTKSTADFALGNRKIGPLIVAATMIATYGSASSFHINLTDKQSLRVSQVSTLIIGGIAIIGSLMQTPEFLSILVYGALGGMGSLVVGPVIMAVFDQKGTKEGAVIASLLGISVFIILLVFYNVWISGSLGMITSIIGAFIFSRVFGSPSATLASIHKGFNTEEDEAV